MIEFHVLKFMWDKEGKIIEDMKLGLIKLVFYFISKMILINELQKEHYLLPS